MSKISNALIMLELLNSGKKYSLDELSTQLGVSKRTVRYYKEQLELSGFFIESFKGPNGGYFINKKNSFNVNYFNKYDIEVLEEVEKIIDEHGPEELKRKYNLLTEKLKMIYDKNKEKSEYTEINVTLHNPSEKIKIIENAINNKQNLKIVYQDIKGKFVKREIIPIMFFEGPQGIYLTSFCKLRGSIRHFEIDKIIEYEIV